MCVLVVVVIISNKTPMGRFVFLHTHIKNINNRKTKEKVRKTEQRRGEMKEREN